MALIRNPQIVPGTVSLDKLINFPLTFLATINLINLTTTFASAIDFYTVPAGKTAIILGLAFEATTATNVTVVPQVSLGIASGETDIFSTETLTNFTSAQDTWINWLVLSKARAAAAGETVKLNLQVPATADTLLANVYLVGFLI